MIDFWDLIEKNKLLLDSIPLHKLNFERLRRNAYKSQHLKQAQDLKIRNIKSRRGQTTASEQAASLVKSLSMNELNVMFQFAEQSQQAISSQQKSPSVHKSTIKSTKATSLEENPLVPTIFKLKNILEQRSQTNFMNMVVKN